MKLARSLAAVLCLASLAGAQAPVLTKQVAAPPEELGLHRLPEPVRALSRSALVPVVFDRGAGGAWVFEATLPVQRPGTLSLALVAPDPGAWSVVLRGPDGPAGDLRRAARTGRVATTAGRPGVLAPGLAAERFDVPGATAGDWRVRLRASSATRPAPGHLLFTTDGPLRLATRLGSYELVAGAPVTLVAAVEDAGRPGEALRDLDARLELVVRDGRGERRLRLHDDGRHGDGRARDGLFGVRLHDLSGDVETRVEARGHGPAGEPFLLSAQRSFPVLEPAALLGDVARARVTDPLRLALEVEALSLGPAAKLHLSAEVWGTAEDGSAVPVCWLSRMVAVEPFAGEVRLPLTLDARWLARAGADLPLELREVRLQDPDTHVPFDRRARMGLEAGRLPALAYGEPAPVTDDMLAAQAGAVQGISDAWGVPAVLAPPALMLVHGYCSGGSVWPGAHFGQPKIEFLDPNQNRTNDEFALLLLDFGKARASFGVVGHSQGGLAALHLLTYYVSPLDHARGGRRIQSLGSPYQGTPLADLGDLGSCGNNFDMSPDGAALWLAGIPNWARAEVHYWTTSNSGSACNFFTNFVLTDPEDGVVEQFRAQLPGANSMGHVTGWCHTTGMTNPAQYTDASRNGEMNAEAAR